MKCKAKDVMLEYKEGIVYTAREGKEKGKMYNVSRELLEKTRLKKRLGKERQKTGVIV